MSIQTLKDEEFLPVAKGLIHSATKTICISTFKAEITAKPRGRKLFDFFQVLADKANSGVDVRVLISPREDGKHIPPANVKALHFFQKTKIKVKHLQNCRLVHAKIILTDNEFAIIGSHNLSVKANTNNFELSVFISDPTYCHNLAMMYNDLWDKSRNTIYKNK